MLWQKNVFFCLTRILGAHRAGSLFQRVTVPENVWDMRPGDFPLPREHSGIHKGDFPGYEVFRTKMDSVGQADPGKFNSWSQYEIALGKETYGRACEVIC